MQFTVPDQLRRFKLTNIQLWVIIALAAIVIVGAILRLLPAQWVPTLDDFDPYIQFKDAAYVVANGYTAYLTWIDPTRWYPTGSAVAAQLGIGLPFTGATAYFFLDYLGAHVSLMTVTTYWPVFSGIVCIILVYALGSTLVNRGVGLLSALVFALDPTAIQRTGLGFFTTESAGLIGLFVSVLFFIKAQKSNTIVYSIIAGLGLAYMSICWGAYLYPLNLFALYLIVMVLLGKSSKNLTVSFVITTAITLFTIAITPNTGIAVAISPSTVLPLFAFVIALIQSFMMFISDPIRRRNLSVILVLGLAAIFIVLTGAGAFGSLSSKFIDILIPPSRVAIVSTVAEQEYSNWFSYFFDYHVLIILAAAGAFFAIRRAWSKDIFVLLFAIAAIYGAASQIRLLVIVAPAIGMLSGIALTKLFDSLKPMFKEKFDRRKGKSNYLSKGYAVLILLIVLVAMFPIVYYNVPQANHPVSIYDSGSGYGINAPDFADALAWIRDQTPANSVVCSWWDYGYWINVMGNRTVTSDNSTTNSTQIALIAEAFLSNESVALPILYKMGVNYILVFEPWPVSVTVGSSTILLPSFIGSGGDTAKAGAMATIAYAYSGSPLYNYSNYVIPYQITGSFNGGANQTVDYYMPAGPDAHDALLFQMLYAPQSSTNPYGYSNPSALGITIDSLQYLSLAYASPDYWVLIYQVNYPANMTG